MASVKHGSHMNDPFCRRRPSLTVLVTVLLEGSMIVTVPSSLVVHTRPSPEAMPVMSWFTGIVSSGRRVDSLTRTTFWSALATQTEPKPNVRLGPIVPGPPSRLMGASPPTRWSSRRDPGSTIEMVWSWLLKIHKSPLEPRITWDGRSPTGITELTLPAASRPTTVFATGRGEGARGVELLDD